jgi:uncharacterized protein (TIGR03067 family)
MIAETAVLLAAATADLPIDAIPNKRRGLMRAYILAVFAAALLLSAAPVLADDKKDLNELQGTWEVTAMFADGKPETDKAKGTTFVIKGDKITLVASEGQDKRSYTIKLDSAKKPKGIDALAPDGAVDGMTLLGIYEIKGDTLTWCVPIEPGGKRPAKVAPKEGDQAMILTAKRVKP